MLHYLTANCNYGGRVTDDKDRRYINEALLDFYNVDAVENDRFRLAPFDHYRMPKTGSLTDYRAFIDNLPLLTEPEVYGLHRNANLTRN